MLQSPLIRFVGRSVLIGLVVALLAHYLVLRLNTQPGPVIELISAPAHARLVRTGDPVSYGNAVRAAAPAVVNVYTAKRARRPPAIDDPLFGQLFGDHPLLEPEQIQTNLGSGVIISPQGVVVTNHHVIADADEVQVMLSDGQAYPAHLLGVDPETDLAILGLNATNLPTVTLGDSEELSVGDVVLAIGNPFGVGQTVTMGIVSATGRDRLGLNTFEDFIQTDAAINPGNSGGALINPFGELVGINTAIFSRSGGSQGIGFAIPARLVRDVAEQILRHGRVIRGWLGVQARDLSPELMRRLEVDHGVLITGVFRDGPADRAGVNAGDILLALDGKDIPDTHRLLQLASRGQPGKALSLRGVRNGADYETSITLSQRPGSR